MKKSYTIGTHTFSKKADAQEYIKNILHSVSLKRGETHDLTEDQSSFMKEVLSMHPRLKNKIPDFPLSLDKIIIRHAEGENYNQFCYVLHGKQPEPFSYLKCLSGSNNYHINDVLETLRMAIQPQIYEYKDSKVHNGKAVCALSGIEFDETELHVDHYYPFRKLVDDFLKSRKLTFFDIEVDHHDNADGKNTIKNKALLTDFLKYHKNHAQLSMVHKKINVTLQDKLKEGSRFEEIVQHFKKQYA